MNAKNTKIAGSDNDIELRKEALSAALKLSNHTHDVLLNAEKLYNFLKNGAAQK